MASSSIKTLSMGGNTYSLEDTQAREALSGKVDKVSGRGLSEDNYTTAEKSKLAGIAAGATANTGTVTGVKMNGVTKGTSGVVDLGTVITSHQNIKTINGQSMVGSGNITIEGGGGGGLTTEQVTAIVQDEIQTPLSGKVDKIDGKGLSSNDYTAAEKSKLAGIASGATANTGTVTGVKMNGVTKGTSGVVDLGTVLTSHQNIKTINGQSMVGSGNITIGGGGESSGVSPDDAVTFCVQEIDVTSNILHYINFASDSARNYVVMNISNGIDTLTLTLDSENQCEHYVLLDNSSNEEDVVVALQTLQFDGEDLDKMIIPEDGISVPAGKYVELSYVVILSSLSVGVVTCSQVLTE